MDTQNHKNFKPYKGLQPYEEENKDIFFGRDAEREILINKVFSNKLTLLFAASGVGKSSLLQAAVLPELKRPDKENLDVVYYRDWVSDPLIELKKTVIQELRKQGKLSTDYMPDPELSLKEFFEICSAFSSEPLVVILDQFEEFFQYRRFREGFQEFVRQMSEAFNDRQTPAVFVISMREDFALELNEFKPHLPTTIFENYFRIEKLGIDKAEIAIRKPVEALGFRYEDELLTELLKDLAEREKQARFGSAEASIAKDAPAFVEPPYLQIVCTHLWNKEKDNPDKIIRAKAYQDSKKAEGIVGSYFEKEISSFSVSEKRIASKAFDHLVTPYGTKMAYPVKDLSGKINEDEKELEKVLEKLQKSRILRSQKREGIVWYELYHDIFSKIIYQWNEKYKFQQRTKKAFQISGLAVVICLMLSLGYDFFINYTSHHFRLSAKSGISDTIEVYRGKSGSKDIFGLQKYEAEMNYDRNQIEPDKLFYEKNIADYTDLNNELIGHFPSEKRILPYIKHGEIQKALDLADISISDNDTYRANKVIQALSNFKSEKSIELLQQHLKKLQNMDLRRNAADILIKIGSEKAVEPLIALLKEQNSYMRRKAADALGKLGSEKAVEPLIALLKEQNKNERSIAAEALVELGSEKAVEPLIALLKNQDDGVRNTAAKVLGKLGSEKAVEPLIALLKEQNKNERSIAAEALGKLGSEKAVESLIALLKEEDRFVRNEATKVLIELGSEKAVEPLIALLKEQGADVRKAMDILGNLSSEKAVEPLIALLKEQDAADAILKAEKAFESPIPLSKEQQAILKAFEPLFAPSKKLKANVRSCVADALGKLGSEKAVEPLIALLKAQDTDVRSKAADALGKLGSEKAVEPLIALLKEQNSYMRRKAADALGKLGSEKAVEPLIALLKEQNKDERTTAAAALVELGSEKAVESLIALLIDQDTDVRIKAADALGKLGSEKAVESLIALLIDQDIYVRRTAAYALGKLGSEKAIEPLIALLIDQDSEAADALIELGSEKAVEPLIALLKDQNADVISNILNILGKLGSEKAVEPLIALLKNHDEFVKIATVDALKKIGHPLLKDIDIGELPKQKKSKVIKQKAKSKEIELPETFDALKTIAIDKKERMPTRLAAITKIGSIRTKEAVNFLLQLLETEDSSYQFRAIQALGNNGYLNPSKAVAPLLKRLKALEDRKAEWRKIRDENTDSYTEPQMEDWRKRLESVKPKPYLECELAYAISRIAPDTEGIKLLNHDLAAVREGAWLGIGKVGTVELLKTLYEERRKKDITPWFRHAAYRAIDHVLIHLESFGNTEDADKLEKFLAEVSEKDEPGVHTRTEWTIERLRESRK